MTEEGKITQPIIVAMQRASTHEAQVIVDYLHRANRPLSSYPAGDRHRQDDTLQFTMARAQEQVNTGTTMPGWFCPLASAHGLTRVGRVLWWHGMERKPVRKRTPANGLCPACPWDFPIELILASSLATVSSLARTTGDTV